MEETGPESEGAGPTYPGVFPFAWQPLSDDRHADPVCHEKNIELIRALGLIDTSFHEPLEDRDELTREWHYLDAKMNVLLSMVSQVLTLQTPLPKPHWLTLGYHHISWRCQKPPDEGSAVIVELYPSRDIPRPLRFSGSAQSIVKADDGYHVTARLDHMTGLLQQEWERFVFTGHRREVASKQSTSGS